MDEGHEHGGHEGEDGQHFGGAGGGPAPFRLGEAQDGGEHDARVADPYPEDEVCDKEAPEYGAVQAGNADSSVDHESGGSEGEEDYEPEEQDDCPVLHRVREEAGEKLPVYSPVAEDFTFLQVGS